MIAPVNKTPKAKIYLSNWLVPRKMVAINIGPISIIKKDWYEAAGENTRQYIERHENIHYIQFLRNPWTHYIRYLFNPKYRLMCEIEAYAHNVVHDKTAKSWVIKFLCSEYGLPHGSGYNEKKVGKLLTEEVKRVSKIKEL
jgi:hypothetical protein